MLDFILELIGAALLFGQAIRFFFADAAAFDVESMADAFLR